MPLPAPTLLTDANLDLYDGVPTLIRSYKILDNATPDIKRNVEMRQGYQQAAATTVGDGVVILEPVVFDLELVGDPAKGGQDMPAILAQLRADLAATREIRFTVDAGTRVLTVNEGGDVTNNRRWGGDRRRVTVNFYPDTITSTGPDSGDWLA